MLDNIDFYLQSAAVFIAIITLGIAGYLLESNKINNILNDEKVYNIKMNIGLVITLILTGLLTLNYILFFIKWYIMSDIPVILFIIITITFIPAITIGILLAIEIYKYQLGYLYLDGSRGTLSLIILIQVQLLIFYFLTANLPSLNSDNVVKVNDPPLIENIQSALYKEAEQEIWKQVRRIECERGKE